MVVSFETLFWAQKVVCSEDDDDDGREALIDRTAPPTVKMP